MDASIEDGNAKKKSLSAFGILNPSCQCESVLLRFMLFVFAGVFSDIPLVEPTRRLRNYSEEGYPYHCSTFHMSANFPLC